MPAEVVAKSGPGAAPAPVAPAPVVPVAVPSPEALALKQERQTFEHQKRIDEVKLKKLAQQHQSQRETDKKTWGDKLSQVERFEKLKAEAKVNPEPYLREVLGDNYYDRIVELKLNGNAPSAESVAQAIARAEEKIEKRFADKEEERRKSESEANEQRLSAMKSAVLDEATQFTHVAVEDYPIFKKLGSPQQVASMLTQRIESNPTTLARYRSAMQDSDADARVALMKSAAEGLEGDILGLVEEATGHQKYQARIKGKLTPATNAGPNATSPQSDARQPDGKQQRRTLSNDLTGTTPGQRTAALSEGELLERAKATRLKHLVEKLKP